MLFAAFAFVPETIRHLTDNHEYWKKAAEDWVSNLILVLAPKCQPKVHLVVILITKRILHSANTSTAV